MWTLGQTRGAFDPAVAVCGILHARSRDLIPWRWPQRYWRRVASDPRSTSGWDAGAGCRGREARHFRAVRRGCWPGSRPDNAEGRRRAASSTRWVIEAARDRSPPGILASQRIIDSPSGLSARNHGQSSPWQPLAADDRPPAPAIFPFRCEYPQCPLLARGGTPRTSQQGSASGASAPPPPLHGPAATRVGGVRAARTPPGRRPR